MNLFEERDGGGCDEEENHRDEGKKDCERGEKERGGLELRSALRGGLINDSHPGTALASIVRLKTGRERGSSRGRERREGSKEGRAKESLLFF